MARKPRQEEGGSLDSLLDTMTNVVGILVIVLIVTQLNVAEALKRIQSNLPDVTEDEVRRVEAMVDEKRKSRQTLETTWSELEPQQEEEEETLDQLKLEIDEQSEENKEVVEQSSDLEELKKLIAEQETKVAASNDEVSKADEELQRLKAMLDETPQRAVAPPKVVRLPNPRPAPEYSEPRFIVCRNDRVYVVGDVYEHLYKVGDYLHANFDQFAYRGPAAGSYAYTLQSATKKNSAGNPDAIRSREEKVYRRFRLDSKKVENYFASNAVGGNDFSYRVKRASPDADTLKLTFELKPEGGESIEEIGKSTSRFAKAVREAGRNYFYYYVAPDSFDAYLEARDLSEGKQIPAGWAPWTTEEFSPTVSAKRETRELDFSDENLAKLEEVSRATAPILKGNYENAVSATTAQLGALLGKIGEVVDKGFPDLADAKRDSLKRMLPPYLKGDKAVAALEGELRSVFGSDKAATKRVYDWVRRVAQWEDDMFKYWAEVEEVRRDSSGKTTLVFRDKRGKEVKDREDGTSFQLVHAAGDMRGRETVVVSPQAPNIPFIKIFKPTSSKLPQLPPKKEGDKDILEPGGDKERQKARKDMLD